MDGSARNKMLRNNILLSGVLKAIGIAISFLIVPITLHYLDKEPYGIWMTISSMAFWIFTFDIGLGNGMRNYLSTAISKEDHHAGRVYISSTFAMLSAIAFAMAILAIPLIFLLDFNKILNTKTISNEYLQFVILIALVLTFINFVVKNIGFIFVALQKYAINDLLTVGSNAAALVVIYLLTIFTEGNLLYVVTVLMAMPVAVFLMGGVYLYRYYPALRPSYKNIDINFSKGIVTKGLGFFFIQITSCLVIFGGSNLLISHFSGPEHVTTYNIAYKYFNLLVIGYTIIIAPMWNAYTDAYVKNDWTWIRNIFIKSLMFWGGTVIFGLLMLLFCDFFYALWVGKTVIVPLTVSASALAYVSFFNLNNCVTYLLNGLNTIRIQIYTSIATTFIYLYMVMTYGKNWGIEGIILCMASCYAVMSLIHMYQCWLIINQKGKGIWLK